ncbi:hypothetical protein SAMN05421594_1231 [Chryseobacterium oleae]|uniref:Uncharacterized protein n=1 Tax=Chryseobacterium oleae TaxID=491207 RepID=A0A1I4WIU3_CHROL|nr:hypothetical protein [Chryseobacterium oleae]SFN13200.1 hypothetical protein SAMN05421594_1231 [Chryseobacterium oleae]
MKIFIHLFVLLSILDCKPKNNIENVKIQNTAIEFKQIKFSDIRKVEKKNNGIEHTKPFNIGLSKNYFPDIEKYEFAQPIIFRRDTANLNTQISYFFTKNDSIVRLIEYSWNQDKKKVPFIDNLYNFNKEFISKNLSRQGEETNEKIDYWWQKIVRWDNDSTHIYSFIFGVNEGQRTRIIVRFKN